MNTWLSLFSGGRMYLSHISEYIKMLHSTGHFLCWKCSLYNTLVDFFLYFRSQFKCQFWENSILIFPNKEISYLLVIFHHLISSDYYINKCMHRYSYMHACVCLVYSDAFHRSDQIRSLALCDPMNHSTPGLPFHHQLPEFTQTHVHRVSDAI